MKVIPTDNCQLTPTWTPFSLFLWMCFINYRSRRQSSVLTGHISLSVSKFHQGWILLMTVQMTTKPLKLTIFLNVFFCIHSSFVIQDWHTLQECFYIICVLACTNCTDTHWSEKESCFGLPSWRVTRLFLSNTSLSFTSRLLCISFHGFSQQ